LDSGGHDRHRVAVLIWRADDASCVRVYLGHGFFLGIFVNWYWGKIFVAGESQKHPEELLSNKPKVLLVLLQFKKLSVLTGLSNDRVLEF
jgi:hypothetical protein